MKNHKPGLFLIISICTASAHAYANPDLFADDNVFTPEDATTVDDSNIFNDAQNIPPLYDENVDASSGLFLASTPDDCSSSLMSRDDSDDSSMGETPERRVRTRSAEESCPNPASPRPDAETIPDFGLLNPGSNLLDFMTPPDTGRAKAPVRMIQPPEGETYIQYLERMLRISDPNLKDDLCPPELVFDLQVPVCHSGNWERDVYRGVGDYFFKLFNVRYCINFPFD